MSAKFQRITISGRNLQFLQELSEQMDEPNLAAVMTYLLTDIRGLGYKFGDKQTPQQQQTPIGYSFNYSTFEPAPIQNNQNVIDPTIQRLIDAGLEMNF